jgi:hypothetical protein
MHLKLSTVHTILSKNIYRFCSELEEIQRTNALTVRPIIGDSYHHVDRENLLPDGGFIIATRKRTLADGNRRYIRTLSNV